ncbi:MAG: bifunctional indole-3-glycerol phosphate synthase/phosphoribosylanthranilate isomerase [Spirochaetaceae bacterium]|nr:bifunctional indole-3-glycerol phosphate synthase/phosphoribosylanthranilate isomerase [Spirochaetaceae bacterium]
MRGTPDILVEIAENRAARVRKNGAAQGLTLPAKRSLPMVSFGAATKADVHNHGILIAEVKRKSPSKGDIAAIPDPAVQAGLYKDAGFRRISVLTEEARFGGSLADLTAVKTAHPELAVLRKDFLLTVEDVEVSCRAGADAVLLIATLLDEETLSAMYRRTLDIGLTPLVEVHSRSDIDKVRPLAPGLVGINSRDLRRFRVEPLLPLETRRYIDWPCEVIYESGISNPDDALFVRGAGFSGFLVGEAVARDPNLAASLVCAWKDEENAEFLYGAWRRLYSGTSFDSSDAPLVKICGITNRGDAEAAVDAGADMIGFILADSPRRTTPEFIRECADLPVMKTGVVVMSSQEELPADIRALLEEGILDFLQFHGEESQEMLRTWPSFKAVGLKSPGDAAKLEFIGSPAVLVDGFSPDAAGGTGKRLDVRILTAAAEKRRLWIAGGLNPENVRGIVEEWKPGLVDVSSGVESSKGIKDRDAVRRFVSAAKGRNA